MKRGGFPLPESIGSNPTRSICITIPDTREYRAAFWGTMFRLAKWYSWDHGTVGDDRAKLAAEEWMLAINPSYESFIDGGTCEGGDEMDVRQNSENPCILEKDDGSGWEPFANLQLCPPLVRLGEDGQPEYSTDEGETWIPFPDAPIPPRVPVEGQDDKCLAAANVENVIWSLYQEFDRLYGDGAVPLVIAAGIIALIAVLIFYPPALPAVFTFVTTMIGFWSTLTGEDYDSDMRDEMRCIIFCNTTETAGVFTFDYDAIMADISTRFTPGVDMNPFAAVYYLLLIIGADGLDRAGTTTAITEAECDCPECATEHCFTIDFETTNGGAEGWTAQGGTYSTGAWSGVYLDPSNQNDIYGYWQFPELLNVTRIDMEFYKAYGSGGNDVNRLRTLYPTATGYSTVQLTLYDANPKVADVRQVKTIEPNTVLAGVGIDLNTGSEPNTVQIYRWTVWYTGTLAAGWTDNCEE